MVREGERDQLVEDVLLEAVLYIARDGNDPPALEVAKDAAQGRDTDQQEEQVAQEECVLRSLQGIESGTDLHCEVHIQQLRCRNAQEAQRKVAAMAQEAPEIDPQQFHACIATFPSWSAWLGLAEQADALDKARCFGF